MLLMQLSSYLEISREFSSYFLIFMTLVLTILLMFKVILYITGTMTRVRKVAKVSPTMTLHEMDSQKITISRQSKDWAYTPDFLSYCFEYFNSQY